MDVWEDQRCPAQHTFHLFTFVGGLEKIDGYTTRRALIGCRICGNEFEIREIIDEESFKNIIGYMK